MNYEEMSLNELIMEMSKVIDEKKSGWLLVLNQLLETAMRRFGC